MARSNETSVLEILADWAAGTGDDWPDLATRRAVHAVEDTVACMIAGAGDESPAAVRRAIVGWGEGPASVAGRATGAPAPWAALANGTAAHALDYDDNVQLALTHASAVLVPALMALGETVGADGGQVIDAFIVGLELQETIGHAVNWSHYNAGWHATSTIGAIGTAGGCARLLGLDETGMAQALSLAVSMAGGPKGQFGSMAKPFHAGLAAQHAVTAAQLAAGGVEGRMEVLEADMGFLDLCGGDFPPGWTAALAHLGDPLAIVERGLVPKRHPCCASTHKALDALLDLRRSHGFAAEDVESIHTLVGSSNKRNLAYDRPQNEREAKFSMQYCLALGLTRDHLRIADFTEAAVAQPEIRALLPRITMTAMPPEAEHGENVELVHEITVRMKDGRCLEATRQYPRGTARDPFSDADRKAKFEDCVAGRLDFAAQASLRETLAGFAHLGELDQITRYLRSPVS
jgi:2-methylcitrate dehydratase PrpD